LARGRGGVKKKFKGGGRVIKVRGAGGVMGPEGQSWKKCSSRRWPKRSEERLLKKKELN